ncbi:MAG TPA: hypothetical protein VFA90_01025 [Terriglobales bacterium]|nr:hypothetical protein [Terriglobales bacterium]
MKARTNLLVLALCLMAVFCFAANDMAMGTWKLNESKSKMGAGAIRNSTVVYEAAGDNVKCTIDGTTSDGQPIHTEWTGKFDGKDYPVTGEPTSAERSYKEINKHTLAFADKSGGKSGISGRIVFSADGKTRTVYSTATDSHGKTVKSVAVYDKQ